jgi:hypothetical protein
MVSIRIPEKYRKGLAAILSLTDDTLEKLITALKNAPLKLFPPSLSETISDSLPDISIDALNDIVETLQSLYYTKQHHDTSPDVMAEDVCDAMEMSGVESPQSALDDRANVKSRLTRLLNIESLNTLAKGLIVLRTNENIFQDARIVTEMRPIFGSDPEAPPTAAVILHMLNITYQHQGEAKEFYIALDLDDLDILQEAIDRADLKAESLKSLLHTANIACIDME